MNEFDFKVGDLVYYPRVSNNILTLSEHGGESLNRPYPIKVNLPYDQYVHTHSFTPDGRISLADTNVAIFPATDEWYKRLVNVYPNLEKPPIKKHLWKLSRLC